MKNYGKFTIGLISVWFLLALFASAAHLFENNANRIGIAVAIAAVAPLLLFSLWFAASENFRKFALSLNPRILTSAQVWRIIGVHLRAAGGSRRTSGNFCAARWVRRHVHRCHGLTRSVAAC
jgi:hypothetical protein